MKRERRKFSAGFKAEVALEAIHGVLTVSELAQKYEVHPVQIAQWKKEVQLHASAIFEDDKKQRADILNSKMNVMSYLSSLASLSFRTNGSKKKSYDDLRPSQIFG
jgi:transposase-like protein